MDDRFCEHSSSELLPWYANGTLDAEARVIVEAHLRDCAACRRQVAGLRALVDALAARPAEAILPDVQAILVRLPGPRIRRTPRPKEGRGFSWQWAWLLLRLQVWVVRREIWAASALVMALGTLVTLTMSGPYSSGGTLPLVLVAPIVAAGGMAFLYGPAVDPALEIELATPASSRLILLARLVLVFGFDLGLGLAMSVVLAVLQPEVSLWPLVMDWLAPMAFLSTLAFLLTVLSTDPGLSVLVSLVLWGGLNVRKSVGLGRLSWPLPDLLAASARPWLWGLALLFGGLALWAAGREERWLGGRT
jgi:hypothetical protein